MGLPQIIEFCNSLKDYWIYDPQTLHFWTLHFKALSYDCKDREKIQYSLKKNTLSGLFISEIYFLPFEL